ncbi:MAG TPA: DUF5103 domain-containing protein [Lacibacter sp.]|nr:DUF5103 domain-containing protein [Lacibacter sp.]HMO89639.1 DUF5103 domain-containing protein [Lacibacter sp.]HMP86627.1 DUF5103 domain-containing protein [Lacibacter sp.]
MRHLPFCLVTGLFLFLLQELNAQAADRIFREQIRSVKFHVSGDQLQYPIIRLNSSDRLALHFDDLDADVKYYSYTFVLCNADWTPAQLSQFDYMRGFANVRIGTYRNSSIALTRYTHYMAEVPDRNTFPTRSGNYLLKVFLNGDTTQLAFTRRFLVVDNRVTTGATVVQPFNQAVFRSHQKIQFQVNVQNIKPTNIFQQVRVVLLQNNRWDNAITNMQPTFIRQNILEYNTENEGLFPGHKEWRWVNLTSLRLQTDRIERGDYTNRGQTLFVKPEGERQEFRYMYYRDANGMYQLGNMEQNNPYWQGDYATVWFRFAPPDQQAYAGKDVYLFGELTNYEIQERNRMIFNPETGLYENSQLLKQGFYDYIYLLRDQKTGQLDAGQTEGNWWETENNYTILVYYRPLGGRADELVGINQVNSLANRPTMERRIL